MPRRIHILEQCIECGQRSFPGHALCRLHYQRVREQSDRARDAIRHAQEVGRGEGEPGSSGVESPVAPGHGADTPRTEVGISAPLPAPPASRYPGSICPHGWPDWGDCAACTDAADFDDGHDSGLD